MNAPVTNELIFSVSGLNRRMDRLEERMLRLEHRLELSDHD